MPILFPFQAFDCLFQSGPSLAHFDTLLTPVFLIACSWPVALSDFTDAPGHWFLLFYYLREQPGSQNPTHSIALLGLPFDPWPRHPSPPTPLFCLLSNCFVSHSKRRISTGNRRDAALAGSNVAPTEITIAATVIQTPSHTLG
jgi:hypothetical protein